MKDKDRHTNPLLVVFVYHLKEYLLELKCIRSWLWNGLLFLCYWLLYNKTILGSMGFLRQLTPDEIVEEYFKLIPIVLLDQVCY